MENRRVIIGDERNLVLLYAVLLQGMSVSDAFEFLLLSDKEAFIRRNNLTDKLENITDLEAEITKQLTRLEEENRRLWKTE